MTKKKNNTKVVCFECDGPTELAGRYYYCEDCEDYVRDPITKEFVEEL